MLTKVESLYKTHGLAGTIGRVLLGACRRAVGYSRSEEVISENDLLTKRVISLPQKLTIRPVEPGDRGLLAAFHAEHGVEPNQRYRVNRYFDHGYPGFLAFVAETLIGYLFWVDNTSKPADKHPHLRIYNIPLEDHEAYLYDFYIAPRHRGGSRALEFFDRAEKSLVRDGYTRAYGLVLKTKRPARLVYATLGYKPIRTAVGHKFFGVVGMLDGRVFLAKPNMF